MIQAVNKKIKNFDLIFECQFNVMMLMSWFYIICYLRDYGQCTVYRSCGLVEQGKKQKNKSLSIIDSTGLQIV
jgi:hypothetical protein